MPPTATFAVELKDETSGAASSAANALVRLEDKIKSDTKALREMQRAMKRLQGGSVVNIEAFRKLNSRIEAQKSNIAAAQSAFIGLGGTFGKTKTKTKSLSQRLSELGGVFQQSGGASSTFGGSLSRLGTLLSSPIVLIGAFTAALVASIVAIFAMVAALGTAIVALARYGLAQSEARRSELLRLEGLVSLREQFGRVTASANDMQAAIDRATDATGIGRSQAEDYARSLTRVGFQGEALAQALEGTALAAQVQGDRGARRFRALAINAALTGQSVRDLADDYRARLGPIARRQMLSLENQSGRLRQSLDRIFSGLRIERFLSAINEVTQLFSQTTVEGRALKSLVEALFQPLFDATEGLGPILRRFFQGMIIASLTLTVAFLRVRNALREAFGDETLFGDIDAMSAALLAGQAIVFTLAAAVIVLGLAFGVLVGAAVAVNAVFVALSTVIAIAIGGAIGGIRGLISAVASAVDAIITEVTGLVAFLQAIDLEMIAFNMIVGLVNGLRNQGGAVRAAVQGLANTARDSFREALGIGSPSQVFTEFGMNISQGVARGVEAGRSEAEETVSGLIEAPGGATIGGATSVSIGDIVINVGADTENPRELGEEIRDVLAEIFSGVSIEVGAT